VQRSSIRPPMAIEKRARATARSSCKSNSSTGYLQEQQASETSLSHRKTNSQLEPRNAYPASLMSAGERRSTSGFLGVVADLVVHLTSEHQRGHSPVSAPRPERMPKRRRTAVLDKEVGEPGQREARPGPSARATLSAARWLRPRAPKPTVCQRSGRRASEDGHVPVRSGPERPERTENLRNQLILSQWLRSRSFLGGSKLGDHKTKNTNYRPRVLRLRQPRDGSIFLDNPWCAAKWQPRPLSKGVSRSRWAEGAGPKSRPCVLVL
jgi:hypothetical protein